MNRIISQLPIKLIILLLVTLPLVWHPSYLSIFEGAKVQYFTLGIDAVLITLLFCRPKVQKFWTPITVALLLFVGMAVISSLINSTFSSSLWGNSYRSDGLWTLLHTIIFSLVIARYYQNNKRLLILSLLIPWALLTVWAVVAWLFPALDLPRARWPDGIALTLGNPNILSGYLVVGLPLLFYLVNIKKSRWLLIAAIILFLGVTLITIINGSWGGMIGIASFIFLSLSYKYKWARSAGLVIMLLALSLVAYFYMAEMRSRTVDTGTGVSESRERIYMKALIAISKKPLLGWGWAQFAPVFQQIDWPTHYLIDARVDKTHSFFLDIGVSTGIVGLLLIAYLSALSMQRLYRTHDVTDYAVLMMLIIYLLHSQTNITSIAEDVFFYLAVGAAMAIERGDKD